MESVINTSIMYDSLKGSQNYDLMRIEQDIEAKKEREMLKRMTRNRSSNIADTGHSGQTQDTKEFLAG